MCWHIFCSTSVEPQTNLFLSHSRPLLQGSPASIPTPIPMRKKRDAKINSQRRRVLLLMLPKDCNQMPDCRPCIQAWAEALSTLKRLLHSTQQAWSSASHHSSCHFKCSPTAPVCHRSSSLRQQIWWSSEYMCFKSCASDKPEKAKLFWDSSLKEKKQTVKRNSNKNLLFFSDSQDEIS